MSICITEQKHAPINWDNMSYDEYCDILEDVTGHKINRNDEDRENQRRN